MKMDINERQGQDWIKGAKGKTTMRPALESITHALVGVIDTRSNQATSKNQ
jgi:hypothetical protein